MSFFFDSSGYTFENGRTVTMNGLPPAPIVWTYNAVDFVCEQVGFCEHWRDYLNIPHDAWPLGQDYRVPSVTTFFPKLLSYPDFRTQIPATTSTVDAVYQYAFETPSTELGDLTTPTAWPVLLGLVFLLRLVKSVLCPYFSGVGRRAAIRTHGEAWTVDNQVRITKFGEYVFRLLYHSVISIYGLVYFYDKEWWQAGNSRSLFSKFPFHEIEPGMAWYYLLQSAYNLDAFYSLLELSFVVKFRSIQSSTKVGRWQLPVLIDWSPTVRGDFREMAVHHVVTNVLIMGSSAFRFTRIGSSKWLAVLCVTMAFLLSFNDGYSYQ